MGGHEEETLLCQVGALKHYLGRINPLVGNNTNRLFVSPWLPKNPASKNALTSLTKSVIKEAHEFLRPDLIPVLEGKIHGLKGAVPLSFHFKQLWRQPMGMPLCPSFTLPEGDFV